jgi:hypothetical protein
MPTIRALYRLALVLAICSSLHSQDDYKLISITLRDGRTGAKITPSNFLLRVDHFETVQSEWVKIYDNGSVFIRVPLEAKEISLQATYESGMDTYINCDVAKQNNPEREIWYPIDAIMKAGVVAPNECGKTEYTAKPGEFVFFVRKRSALDRIRNPDAQ